MNKKTVVIHQPDFMPHLGFFHRFLHADLYIALDHVQFVNGSSRSWTHRDKIKTAKGEQWLSLSIEKAPRDTPINKINLSSNASWRQDNIYLLEHNYRKSAFYDQVMPTILKLYNKPFKLLRDFNIASIEMLMDMLDVRIPWIKSSDLGPNGVKNELLVDLLKKVSATHYLSGVGARDYFNHNIFKEAGIEVVWQNYLSPEYPQLHGKFIPNLSSIDILLNCGIVESRKKLKGCK